MGSPRHAIHRPPRKGPVFLPQACRSSTFPYPQDAPPLPELWELGYLSYEGYLCEQLVIAEICKPRTDTLQRRPLG